MKQRSRPVRYTRLLKQIPRPGGKGGCHPFLLRVANAARRQGRNPERVVGEILRHIPPGKRVVTETEVRQAVEKAYATRLSRARCRPKPSANMRARKGVTAVLQEVMQRPPVSMEQMIRRSPVSLAGVKPDEEAALLLSALYHPDEHIFVGSRYETNVRPVREWLADIRAAGSGQSFGPLFVPNPFTGRQALTKKGTLSYRCDAAVAAYRFALAEFDGLALGDQLKFFANIHLPISALIYSGGKSIHALLRVDARDEAEWDRVVRGLLFADRLIPCGVDPSCSNPSRLSRLPGAQEEGRAIQRLIYLDPQVKGLVRR